MENLDKLIITTLGALMIVFTYWFFLMKKGQEVAASDSADSIGSLQVDIEVNGGYSPEVVSIPYGKTTKLNFIRKDPNDCLEEVVLGDFKIKRTLPLNEKVIVELTPKKKGEFGYSCGMGMFHGKIVVR